MTAHLIFDAVSFGNVPKIKKKRKRKKKKGHEVIKPLSCSAQLLINVKMSTIVGILKFISINNATSENFTAIIVFIFLHFTFYEQLKFHSLKEKYNLGRTDYT